MAIGFGFGFGFGLPFGFVFSFVFALLAIFNLLVLYQKPTPKCFREE
jgi:hypothetical protein